MKKSKKKKNNGFFIFIFILGFLILLYPQVSRIYYRVEANKKIDVFDKGRKMLSEEELQRRMELAKAYNASLINNIAHDPYSEKEKEEGKAAYARMLEIHEQMGHINIPKINTNIPIYAGTSEEVLQKGAGHLEGTSLPIGGNYSHTVITAHSGLPKARLFTDLNKVEKGDRFYIHNIKEVLAYEVDQIKVVEPKNFSDLLIVPGHDYATLLTCTPIMINTHRLLVRGHRVNYEAKEEQRLSNIGLKYAIYKYSFYGSCIALLVLSWWNIDSLKKKKKYMKILKLKKIDYNVKDEFHREKENNDKRK